MDTLELLTTRRSNKSLRAPAPDELQLDSILQAASQVPDHGNLTPWRFVVTRAKRANSVFRLPCAKPRLRSTWAKKRWKKPSAWANSPRW